MAEKVGILFVRGELAGELVTERFEFGMEGRDAAGAPPLAVRFGTL